MNPPSSNSDQPNKWFVCPQFKPEAESRMFLFPYAGGGPSVFNKWDAELPNNIEMQIVHYPGRGSRYNEPPIKSLMALVERLAQVIQPLLDKPYAFFGHSLGGTIAFELARHLQRNRLLQPVAIFLSACGAPQVPDSGEPIHTLPDDDFLKTLRKFGGIQDELLRNHEILSLSLSVLRADFEVSETYHFIPGEPLDFPILAFGGLDDMHVSREGLDSWSTHTKSRFETKYFPGDHFFINTAQNAVIESIIEEINP